MSSRLHQTGYALLFAIAIFVAGCGGGGGGAPIDSGPVLRGSITAAANTVMDSDTNDPFAPLTRNNTPATAQDIPNPATVGGFLTATATFEPGDAFATENDVFDAYRATLYAGQTIVLTIAEFDTSGADLDLYLYLASDTSTPVESSIGVTGTETITVPNNDTYFVVVHAFGGTSNYILNTLAPSAGASAPTAEFVPGEMLVRLHKDSVPAGVARPSSYTAGQFGLTPKSPAEDVRRPMLFGLPRDATLRHQTLARLGATRPDIRPWGVPAPAADQFSQLRHDTLMAIKALRQRPEVRSADPNYIYRPTAVPNDTFYGYQWHYPLINLPQAWDIETGASNPVIVAVVDTGVYLAHSDLAGKLVNGYDFISNIFVANDGDGIDADPDDPGDSQIGVSSSFHGTHVAGTIAAASNNSTGVAGVSWGARIMPIRVLGVGGGTSYDIMQGNYYAAGLANDSGTLPTVPADIINLSLGCQNCYSQTEQDAYAEIRDQGVIVIAAAGNSATSAPGYPASYDGVVSVSAVDYNKELAPYSNYGSTIDVAAPGGDTSVDRNGDGYADGILSTLADDSMIVRQPSYNFYQGTSMAAPHMAGVVALMKARNPGGVNPTTLDSWLQAGNLTEDLAANGATVRDDQYGYGLIDAAKAVQAASTAAPTILTITPNPLNFGSVATTLTLTLDRSGGDPVIVNSVTPSDTWISVTAPGSVDGLGNYSVEVNRSGLVAGTYTENLLIDYTIDAAPRQTSVAVTVTVGSGGSNTTGDTGFVWLILVDTATLQTAATINTSHTDGIYDYAFRNVSDGVYYILGGSDSDNDDVLCDEGESCGGYPTLGTLQPIVVTGSSIGGLDFSTNFPNEVGTSSALRKAPPLRGGFDKWPQEGPQKELNP